MPDLQRREPTDFSSNERPPTAESEINQRGTASYMAKVAKPLAKRMAKIIGIGHRKMTDLDLDSLKLVSLALVLH